MKLALSRYLLYSYLLVCTIPSNLYAQCLTSLFPQYPSGAAFVPSCSGTVEVIDNYCYGSEYSLVQVVSGNSYTFTGGPVATYITISNSAGTTALAFGTSPVTWVATFSGPIRFYSHVTSACQPDFGYNDRSVTCGSVYNPCTVITPISACLTPITASFTGGAGAWDPVINNCGYFTPGREQLFTFTAPITGTYQLQITSATGGFVDYFWKPVSSGGCTNTSWNCIGDFTSPGTYSGTNAITLTAGVQYYFMLDPEGTGARSHTFQLICPPPPDPCLSITTIANCGISTTSTMVGTGAYDPPSTACTGTTTTPGAERIYMFTAPNTGTYQLQVTAATGGTVDYMWRDTTGGCGGSGWNCIRSTNTTGTYAGNVSMAFTAGSTYYILLDPQVATPVSHTFQLNCPPPPDPTGITAFANPICSGGSVTLSVSGGFGTSYWYTGSCGGTQIGTGPTVSVSPSATTTYFVRNFNGGVFSTNCASLLITVEQPLGNNLIGANQTLCSGLTPSPFTGTVPTGGNTSYTYAWESSLDNSSWSGISGETLSGYSSPGQTSNTYVRRIVSGGVCSPSTSGNASLSILPLISTSVNITVSPSSTVCSGDLVTYTATPVNGGSSPIYQWYLNSSPVGANSSTFTSTAIPNGSQIYATLQSSVLCPSPSIAASNTLGMTVNPIPATPVIVHNGPLCAGSALQLSVALVTGATYNWIGPNGFTSGLPVDTRNPVVLADSGIYSVYIVVTNCTSAVQSALVSITDPIANNVIGDAQTICAGSSPNTLTGSLPSGGSVPYSYVWESSPDLSTWSSAGGNTINFSSSSLTATTYFRRLISGGFCGTSSSSPLQITVEDQITGNIISPSQTLCTGYSAIPLSGALPSGGNGNYIYQWESSVNNTSWNALPGVTTFSYQPSQLLGTTYYRRIIVSGVCAPSTSASESIMYEPSPGNNILTGSQTLCAGFSPLAFTGSVPTGGNGIYTYDWESSTDSLIWVLVPGANNQNYTPLPAIADVWYRRVVTSGICSDTSLTLKLTVLPGLSGNAIGSSQTLCQGTLPALLTGQLPSGGVGSYLYTWETSTNTISWAGVGSSQDYTPGVLGSNTYFRRIVQSTGLCTPITSTTIQIEVQPLPGNNLIGNTQTICNGSLLPLLTGTIPTGGTQIYTYQWETSPDQSTWTADPAGITSNYTALSIIGATYYRRIVTSGVCAAHTSDTTTITYLAPITGNTIGNSQTLCLGSSILALTGATPSGGDGSFSYQWESSLNQVVYAPISGATLPTYTPAAIAGSIYYRRIVTGFTCPSTSADVEILQDLPIGNNQIGVSQTICAGIPASLTGTIPTGGNSIFSYQWESWDGVTTWTSIPGGVGVSYSPPSLLTSAYYRRIVTSAGVCPPSTSSQLTIEVVSAITNNTIGNSQTICFGSAMATLSGTTPGGGTGVFNYQWESSLNQVAYTSISGANAATYLPAAIVGTVYYRRSISSSVCQSQSNDVEITNDLPVGSNIIGNSQTLCAGIPAQLTGSLPTGGNSIFSYQWESWDGVISWNSIPASTGIDYQPSFTTSTTYYRRIVTSAGICPPSTSAEATITFSNGIDNNFIGNAQTLCSGSSANTLTGTLPTGGNSIFSYQWESSINSIVFNSISGATNSIYSPGVLTSQEYYRRVVNSVNCISTSDTIGIQVDVNIGNNIIGNSQTVCPLTSPLAFTGSLPTGGDGNFSYQWESSNNTLTWAGVSGETNTGTLPPAPVSNTYYRRIIQSGACPASTSASLSLAVWVSPTATISGTQTLCVGLSTTITVSLTGSQPWSLTFTDGTTPTSITGITSSPLVVSITPTTTRTYSVVSVADVCSGNGFGQAVITVLPSPTVALAGDQTICNVSSTILTFTFTGTPPWNITYQDGFGTIAANGILANPYLVSVSPSSTRTYLPIAIVGGCNGGVSGSAGIIVNPIPSATLSGTQTICAGQAHTLTVQLTGASPWSFSYTNGTTTQTVTGVTNSPYLLSVTPSVTSTYSLTNVFATCAGSFSGTARVQVNPVPTASISGAQSICSGNGVFLTMNLTGVGPWNVAYTDGASLVPVNGIQTSPFIFIVSPTTSSTYQIASVFATCNGTTSGSSLVHVANPPSAFMIGNNTICQGDSTLLRVALTGTSPWIFTWSDGTNSTIVSGVTSSPYQFRVTPAQTTTYSISSVYAICSGTPAGIATVVVNPVPTASVSGIVPVCNGNTGNVSVPLTGVQPWSLSYTDGFTNFTVTGITSQPYLIGTTPIANETYTLLNVFATCAGTVSGSVIVQPEPPPTATLSGNQTVCISAGAYLTINFTGTGPWDVVYTDGVTPVTISGIINNPTSYFFNPGAPATRNYTLTSVVGACAGTPGGSAQITVHDRPRASFGGPGTACTGGPDSLFVQLSGAAPWDVTYSDGTNTLSETGITTNPIYYWNINPTASTTYQLVGVSDLNCQGYVYTNPVIVNTLPVPTVTFSGNQTICKGNAASLSLQFSGTPPYRVRITDGVLTYQYPNISQDTIIKLYPTSTIGYSISYMGTERCAGVITGTALVTVIPNVSNAIASFDTLIGCGSTASLLASLPTVGNGTWTVLQGPGIVANPNSNATSVSGLWVGTNIIEWRVSSPTCANTDTVVIEVFVPPGAPSAGPDQQLCSTATTLGGMPGVNGIGIWTVLSGNAIFLDAYDPQTPVSTLNLGVNQLLWTVTGQGGCTVEDTVMINVALVAPVANAGADQTLCTPTAFLLAAPPTFGGGYWTINSGPSIFLGDSTLSQVLVGNLTTGFHQYIWHTYQAGCQDTDLVELTIIDAPVAGYQYNQFGFDVDFVNISGGGAFNYTWNFGDNTTSTAVSPHHTYLNAGTYKVTLIIENFCTKDTIEQIILIGGLSADLSSDAGIVFDLFPNPSTGDDLNIALSGLPKSANECTIRLVDIAGHTLFEKLYPGTGESKLHLELNTRNLNLSKGVYWIELEMGELKHTRKWIIQ